MNEVVTPSTTVKLYDKKIMLACPFYKTVTPQTAFSIAQLRDRRRTSAVLNYGDAFVAHMRNHIADAFLASESDFLLTVDDDMIVPFGNANWFNAHTGFALAEPFCSLNALDRLMSHGKTLVGALYFGRHRSGKPMFNEAAANDTLAKHIRATCPRDELLQTRWVGTGCLLIHRSVFEDIERRFPALARKSGGGGGQWFSTSEHTLLHEVNSAREFLSAGAMTGEKCLKVFSMLDSAVANAKKNSSLGMGEDVQFCIRAAQAGHQPHVDLGCLCGHVGTCVFGPKNTA